MLSCVYSHNHVGSGAENFVVSANVHATKSLDKNKSSGASFRSRCFQLYFLSLMTLFSILLLDMFRMLCTPAATERKRSSTGLYLKMINIMGLNHHSRPFQGKYNIRNLYWWPFL